MIISAILCSLLGCTAQQQKFESLDTEAFEQAISDTSVVRLDVRSDIYLYLCRHLLHFRNYYKMKEIIDFLRDLSCNNNKEWFTANKQRYQEVLSHWHEFVSSHPHEKNVWITS